MAVGFGGLDDAIPADNSFIGDGAAQIRSVKAALNTAFPAVTATITKPSGYGPSPGSTQPTEADFAQLFTDMDALVSPSTTNSPVIPQGMVAMWNGDTTDTAKITALNDKGWYLCVGGTAPNGFVIPNLQDKFVKGWGAQIVGATGGNTGTVRTNGTFQVGNDTNKTATGTYTITEANLPEHHHLTVIDINADDEGALTSGTVIRKEYSPGGVDSSYFLRGNAGTPNIGKTDSFGSASPTPVSITLDEATFGHEHKLDAAAIEPGYYVIAYIIYAGVV